MAVSLIIDDNRQTADTLSQMLNVLGFETQVAYGASAGLGVLKQVTPRAVFLDINMPGLDGFEVLGYLRREPRFNTVPVIVVTSDDQPETAKRVADLKARALIIKPVMLDTLEAALKSAGML